MVDPGRREDADELGADRESAAEYVDATPLRGPVSTTPPLH